MGDAAFCSLQWSKPTTTGLGGIARCNRPELDDALARVVEKEFREPPLATSVYLGILSSLYRSWYRPSLYWTAQRAYRWAGSRGLVRGSSSEAELITGEMPDDYQQTFGTVRTTGLRAALAGLPAQLVHRRRVFESYRSRLGEESTWLPPAPPAGQRRVALRYPALVENREELLQLARQARVEIGDWFNAPLHPRGCAPDVFRYNPGDCPAGEWAAARVINLPTHHRVTPDAARRSVEFVLENAVLSPPGSSQNWESPRQSRGDSRFR
jgi:hypothetical protein